MLEAREWLAYRPGDASRWRHGWSLAALFGMTIHMTMFRGFGLAIVATLALAGGVAHAALQPAARIAGATTTAPTTVVATPPAAPNSPLLAMDGAPAMTPDAIVGHPRDRLIGLQPQVTRNGQFASWMHNDILVPVITMVSLFVLVLLLYVVGRYRKAAHPIPTKTSHNTTIEVIWTLAPVLVLAGIAIPSISLLQAQYRPAPAGAVTLKAIGNQWYWKYQYPDHGNFDITANMLKEKDQVGTGERARIDADGPRLLATDSRVVLPVGVPIRLITTSNDVIHSWAVPAFWIKLDAVPGRLNETSFTIGRPGLYFGQCSELCGARHGFMPIAVEAVPPATFAAWVRAKGGTMPASGKASNKVVPQPSADQPAQIRGADAAAASNASGLITNGVAAAPVITQPATGNPAGAGNAGH